MTHVRAMLLDGRPFAVTGHDSGYDTYDRVWDLAAGRELADDAQAAELAESVIDDDGFSPEVSINGRTYAMTFSRYADPAISFRDPDTGEEIEGTPLGPTDGVTAFATGSVGGRPVVVLADQRWLRVWDLTGERPVVTDELVFPQAVNAVAVTPEGRLLVGFGYDIAALSCRRLPTGL